MRDSDSLTIYSPRLEPEYVEGRPSQVTTNGAQ